MAKKKIEDAEVMISKSLMIGVSLSALIIFIGFTMFIVTGKSGYPSDTYPTDPINILRGFIQLKSFAIILTGLMLLILTPVFRVAISIFVFIKEKDYLYVKITAIVFTILIISFLLGKVE